MDTRRSGAWALGLVACLLLLPGMGAAQEPEPAEDEPNRAELPDPFRPRYIVESIEVRGNHKTLGSLIISHLLLEPGDTLDEEKVQLSRIRLLALGYFHDVHLSLEKGTERGRVKLVVEVDERNTIIIDDLFFGVSDVNPWWVGAGVSDINFLGRGLVFSLAGVGSAHQQAFRMRGFWPSVFNTRFQAGIELMVSLGEERAKKSRVDPCRESPGNPCPPVCTALPESDQIMPYKRLGGTLNLGVRLDRVHRISFDVHAEHIDSGIGSEVYCANHPFKGYLWRGQSTYSSLTFRLERDTRDDFFLPTRGMYLTVSIELASKIFGSDYEFSKYMVSYEHSFPAFSDHAFRFSIVGGLIQDVGEPGSPFFSRFFVGDYAFFLVDKAELPRNLELNFSEVVDYGDLMGSISVEYDIPMWSRGKFFYRGYVYAAANFSIVTKAAFLASEDEWSGKTKRPMSMDIGFKVDTPIGLFTLSIGYIFDLFL